MFTTIITPGIPHRNNYISDEVMETLYQNMRLNNVNFDKYRVCKQCNILVNTEQKITLCEECDICIIDLDHHCTWVGKCIAKKNIFSFNVFLISTILYIVILLVSLILYIIYI